MIIQHCIPYVYTVTTYSIPSKLKQGASDNLDIEELEEVPLMNALYYFPSQAEFKEEDRDLTVGSTTLLYDNWHQRWAVGMTGGGMDLSPDLAATFVNLGWGVPVNIAGYLRANYRAYIDKELHLEVCRAVGKAMEEYGEAMRLRGVNLLIEAANPNI